MTSILTITAPITGTNKPFTNKVNGCTVDNHALPMLQPC